MQQLQPAQTTPCSRLDLGWLHHVVLPLLRPTGAQRAPTAFGAGSHAVLHRPAPRRTYTGGCFAGAEGAGCELSAEELRVAEWVGNGPMSWEA